MVILINYYIESLLQFENDHTGSQKAQKKDDTDLFYV